jgi:thioredoxin-like negative regulator of GroEL
LTKPVVDGLERDLKGRAAVLRLDLLSGVGRDAASQYGVKAVPTTLVFDGNGQVVLRQVGSVDAGAIRAQVADLTAAR